MLIKIADDLILDKDELLSIEKTMGSRLTIYFKNREKPLTYMFTSHEARNAAFEKIIEKNR